MSRHRLVDHGATDQTCGPKLLHKAGRAGANEQEVETLTQGALEHRAWRTVRRQAEGGIEVEWLIRRGCLEGFDA